jgi:hypothetical protein
MMRFSQKMIRNRSTVVNWPNVAVEKKSSYYSTLKKCYYHSFLRLLRDHHLLSYDLQGHLL